ncbi:MAG: hypothetical protein GY754_27770 [bacterium]|nr:hypothetical protein [bacterium]
MKKLVFLAIITILAVSVFGCGQTEVNWQNSHTNAVNTIQWQDSSGNTDQTWNEEVASGASNDFRQVEVLTGQAECSDGGPATAINIEGAQGGGSAYTLTEGSSETLVIQSLK